jgi:hypothetical protein
MGEGRSEISLFGPVYLKNITSAKDIKKNLSFLTGLSSSTWLRYLRIRGLTKHHKTISQSLQQAETLKQSILKKAFEGNWVKSKELVSTL